MANLIEISKQDKWLTDEARKLTEYLVNSGTIQDLNVRNERVREVLRKKQEIEYQNTELLLRQYRDIAWQLEYAPFEIAADLNYACENIGEVIKAFDHEFFANNKSLEYRLERLEHSVQMFESLNEAITLLKKKPTLGERLYRLIYMTYVEPEQKKIDVIAEELCLSRSQYYKLRKTAISLISTRLWYSMPSRQVGILIEAAQSVL